MTVVDSILLLLPTALQVWLALVLLRKRLHSLFPFFFAYTAFAIAASVSKLAVQANYPVYFSTYWLTEAGYAVLGLLATFEVFPPVFKTFSHAPQFRAAMLGVVLLMTALGVLHAILKPPIQIGTWIGIIYSSEITVRYVQAGIFLFLIAMAAFYGIHLRRYTLGIISGFGLLACGRLAALLLRSEFGIRFKFLFTYMPGMYISSLSWFWLITFLKSEPPDPLEETKSPLTPQEIIERVRKLTRALKGQRRDSNLLASNLRWAAYPGLSAFPETARRAACDHHRSPPLPAPD